MPRFALKAPVIFFIHFQVFQLPEVSHKYGSGLSSCQVKEDSASRFSASKESYVVVVHHRFSFSWQ